MATAKITVVKTSANEWLVVNESDHYKSAKIVRYEDYNPLGCTKSRYRVDMYGRTRYSMLDSLVEAKKLARSLVM